MKGRDIKADVTLGGAVVGAVAASLCCILPVIAAALGLAGFAAAEFFARWRPYFLGGTFGLLGAGFYWAYRSPRQQTCEPGSVCERTPVGRWNRLLLWLAAGLVILFSTFPFYSGLVIRALARGTSPASSPTSGAPVHVVLGVEGMDCPACAGLLQNNLRAVPGVRKAEVSFQEKQAVIDYDTKRASLAQVTKVVTDAGYKAKVLSPVSR